MREETKRPLKVLMFVTEDWYLISHRSDLLMGLVRLGFDMSVGTRLSGRFYSHPLWSVVESFHIPFRRSLRSPLMDTLSLFLVTWKICIKKPDIVHLVALKPILLSSLAIFLKPRCQFIFAFAGLGYIFSAKGRSTRLLRRIVVKLLTWIGNRPNVSCLVQNQDDRKLLRRLGIAENASIEEIQGSGVSIDVPKINHRGHQSSISVLLPARLLKEKGVFEFIEAAKILRERDDRYKFVLAGSIDADNPGAIPKGTIQNWCDQGWVEWYGYVQEMHEVYSKTDIVCLLSYREGLPKALIEASAFGIPIIATDVPGCRVVCKDSINGYLIKPGEIDQLVSAIEKLANDWELREEFGSNGRALVGAHFSNEIILKRTSDYYKDLAIGRCL